MNAESLIEIDGSQGEGGGQIIRSSLSLSAVTGKPFRAINIRGGRKKPGLKNQHVLATQAVGRICSATIEGDHVGSSSLTFEPNSPVSGTYEFRMQTAGSTSLVAQTILPLLIGQASASSVTIEGGTHNPMAPTFDFLQKSFLPQLGKFGPRVDATIKRHGFYPRGGGKVCFHVQPCESLAGFELLERGRLKSKSVTALIASLPVHIGEREINTFCRKAGWSKSCGRVVEIEGSLSPCNILSVDIEYENVTACFTAFGEQGKTAERVAQGLYRQAKVYLDHDAPVEEYLADQLILPMGLAAARGRTSRIRTGVLSSHSKTHLDVLKLFLDVETEVKEVDQSFEIEIRPPQD